MNRFLIFAFLGIAFSGCEGPEGPMGPKGEDGVQGLQGVQGPRGVQGSPGSDGVTFYLADFNDPEDLYLWQKTGSGTYRIEQGRAVIRGGNGGLLQSMLSGQGFSGNADITVTTDWLQGDREFAYGIQFCSTNNGSYGFGININGGFSLTRWDTSVLEDGVRQPIELVGWTVTSLINLEGTNFLRVLVVEGWIRVYINGVQVGEHFDTTHTMGSIGIFVSGNQEVAFDNLFVQPLNTQPLLKAVTESAHTLP